MKKSIFIFSFCLCLFVSCSSTRNRVEKPTNNQPQNYKILSLGDSYTIGESVCETCLFPEQLRDSLQSKFDNVATISLKVIAKTGWTTTNLIKAIVDDNPTNDYDLVTLLIGVNNQYQHKPFSLYETEFPELLNKAISLAKGFKSKVIVVSIPDYAYTSFGQGRPNFETISAEIDQYNAFAKSICQQNEVTFVEITDISRQGLNDIELVASDGLHPSALAYTKFVERLRPVAFEKIQ